MKRIAVCLIALSVTALAVAGPASTVYFSANGQAVAHESLRSMSAMSLPGLRRIAVPGADATAMNSTCSMRLVFEHNAFCEDDTVVSGSSYFRSRDIAAFKAPLKFQVDH